jgi:outer membrane immunogenic protein
VSAAISELIVDFSMTTRERLRSGFVGATQTIPSIRNDDTSWTRNFPMKKILLASVAALATVSAFSAFAADLPSRKAAPVYAPPPPMWTGFYAGLNAGYNFGTNSNAYASNWGGNWVDSFPGKGALPGVAALATSASASNTQSGFIGGGQVGYNYQYGSNIVIGVEADIQGSGVRGSSYGGGAAASGVANPGVTAQPVSNTVTVSSTNLPEGVIPKTPFTNTTNTAAVGQTSVQSGVDWLGTVRGRIGYLWTPTLLVYGTGGLAYGNAYANVVQSAVENVTTTTGSTTLTTVYNQTNTWLGGGRQNQILTGWTAGGGAEWLFAPNWSVKAEALYWDLGRQNVQTSLIGVSGNAANIANNIGWGRTSVSYQGVIARAGVNYHFNWGAAPVVASY